MDTSKLKKFAQFARRCLIEQVDLKLRLVLSEDSTAKRENPEAIWKLQEVVSQYGKEQVVEQVAYTWFNRFCALRFMDINRYTGISIVSPAERQIQPEILAEAKMGYIDDEFVSSKSKEQIFALLDGRVTSRDPQGEAYQLLIIEICNYWHRSMPFLFDKIDDYTGLLIPEDLLSEHSVLSNMREAMTAENCKDVEVVGWLYQFYISEKKDQVFEGLKKNKKITPENIPAATQLFTPHWIVRYLVENSLGRLWMLNRPDSKLVEQMEYYIKPDQAVSEYLRVKTPEDIKICDPACGSGHMLTYAFDLLYAIYEEEGYEPTEIPEKILKHNLYGIEIDKRAGELAAFALIMKARAKQRHIFRRDVQPNICVLKNVRFEEKSLKEYIDFLGRDLFTPQFLNTLHQFEEADNFGSLICPVLSDIEEIIKVVKSSNAHEDLLYKQTHEDVLKVLMQTEYLSPKYHVVIANPPYMGGKGMNSRLVAWAIENYPNSKSDFFSMFIERGLKLPMKLGYSAMVTMQSWMFLSSFEKLRLKLMDQTSVEAMVHMGNMVMGIAFGTSATIWKINGNRTTKGGYCYVGYEDIGVENKPKEFPPKNERNKGALKNNEQEGVFRASAEDFKKIPGSPIAYWVSCNMRTLFAHSKLGQKCETRLGMATANNDFFLRRWYEVSSDRNSFDSSSRKSAELSKKKWFPYQKGGEFRKWFGNYEYLVNWQNDGYEIRNFSDSVTGKVRSHNYNLDYIFREGITWNALTSSKTSARISKNSLFDNAGSSLFPKDPESVELILSYLNSCLIMDFISLVSPTLNYQPGDISKLPAYFEISKNRNIIINSRCLIELSKNDWDSYETSWDFTKLPLLQPNYRKTSLKAIYTNLRAQWQEATLEMQQLEEENNRIFIEAYGLQDELTPEVPLNEITLTCNPHYRYGNKKTEEELEVLLLADTVREFISYAVGCMFGRYSLEQPGLILANQGETIEDYMKKIPSPSFPPVKGNVIPILDSDWFSDDIFERFQKFLRITFGDENYEENLNYIENALGKNGKALKIRDYFLNEFYSDHVKRYKKRPIYWLFSSPKGSFNALIYMHRYRPDTVSVVLNDYLREFRAKLTSFKSHLEAVSISTSSSQSEKTKALKEIEKVNKKIIDVEEYEREVLYPLASKQVKIDLDDGVKVNYPKFGSALKKIPGLESKGK